jgi:hypothetical protein
MALAVDGESLEFTVNGEVLTAVTELGSTSLSGIGPVADVEPGAKEECRFDNFPVTDADSR